MSTKGIEAVFQRWLDGWARHDAIAIAALYAENSMVESPIGGRQVGRAAIERTIRIIFAAFPDFHLVIDEFLVFSNRAVSTFTATGTDSGGFMGFPPTMKLATAPIMSLFPFGNDDEIVHERRIYDLSRVLLNLADADAPATEY